MASPRTLRAVRFIRKLRGGSQPILVQAEDDQLYVVKFLNNPQGPQVLTNEVLGTETYRMAGLPVPSWQIIRLTDRFIDANPGCWMEAGRKYIRLQAGPSFGSQYLGASIYEKVWDFLTDNILADLQNRADFWTAAVLDTMLEESDFRQTVFVNRDQGYRAVFVDHGGGSTAAPTTNWNGNWFERVRFYDQRVYAEFTPETVDNLYAALSRVRLEALKPIYCGLPISWKLTGFERYLRITKKISDSDWISHSGWIPEPNRIRVQSPELRGVNDRYSLNWRSGRESLLAKVSTAVGRAHFG